MRIPKGLLLALIIIFIASFVTVGFSQEDKKQSTPQEKTTIDQKPQEEKKPEEKKSTPSEEAQEKYDEAEAIITKREKIHPNSGSNPLLRACLYAAKGEKVEALEMNESDRYTVYLFLKKKEEVIQYLYEDFERIKKSENSWYIRLKNEPVFDFIRPDPRFQEIVSNHKELHEENLAKYGEIDI